MLGSKVLQYGLFALAFPYSSAIAATIAQISVGHSDLTYGAGSWDLTDTEFVCGGSLRYTTGDPGAEVSLKFRGTGIGLYIPRSPEGAQIEIDIDGEKAVLDTQMRTYDCTTPVYVVSDLAFRQHTVKVKTLNNGTLYVSKFVYNVPDVPSDQPTTITVTPAIMASPTPCPEESHRPSSIKSAVIGVSAGAGALVLAALIWFFLAHRRLRARDQALKENIEAAAKSTTDDDDSDTKSIEKVQT